MTPVQAREPSRVAKGFVRLLGVGEALRTNWFIVIYAIGQWWVDNEGHAFGPFPSREVAALEALEYAKRLGDSDRISLIYWPDKAGKMTLVREVTTDRTTRDR